MNTNHYRRHSEKRNEQGNAILEFALVMVFLVPMFAGAFTIGMALAKGIQISNVARDAAVLMVRAITDPNSGLDLSLPQNQRIIVRAASGLGMNSNAQQDPDPNGKSVVFLSKVVMVGPAECSVGITPAPAGAPPWNAGNCPNYGQYVFAYRVVIGNAGKWTSTLGTPGGTVKTDGTISALDIATASGNRVANFQPVTGMTLTPGGFALVSEMFADVSFLNFFNILSNPTMYARSIS